MPASPAASSRIHESLDTALARRRVVLWYDPNGEWASEFDAYQPAAAQKLRVEGNEFSVKVAISRAPLAHRFLLYLPSAKPSEPENWLLDLLLAGHDFTADRASLDIQEAGLTLEFKELAQQHKAFFRSPVRTTKLKELLRPNDDEAAVRLKMLAVLSKQQPNIDQLLQHAFSQLDPADKDGDDSVEATYGSAQLSSHFWQAVGDKFGYRSPEPNLRDFAVALFNSVSSIGPAGDLQPHGRVFLSIWKDSLKGRAAFEQWSDHLAGVLRIEDQLNDAPESYNPDDDDSYELIERFVLSRLLQRFQAEAPDAELLETIRNRSNSCWFGRHQHGYRALEQAITFRQLLGKADLQVPSFEEGLQRYCNSWWRLDQAYRRCIFHARTYQQPGLFKPLREWLENQYVNNVLLPLTNRWSDQVSQLSAWSSNTLPRQKEFHMRYVHAPLSSRGLKRLFVVISDALRYEAARDFADRLNSQAGKGWNAEVEALLGVLPSYTQLGMAALLPGAQLGINPADGTALVDGQSATGTDNRDKILKAYANGRAKAIQAEDFLNLPTTKEGAELIKDHDLIVVYHNRIDRIGDKRDSEADTCQAVEQAFDELDSILRKITSLKGSQAVITADHGFLFQQEPVDANDRSEFPKAKELSFKNRRFALGTGIQPSAGQKVFTAADLGLSGKWEAVFSLGLDRYPRSGSGSRFVHGGTSLQEVVVPVIRLKKERKDESRPVAAELLRVPAKITTSRLPFGVFQLEPVEPRKRLPLQLRITLVAKADGALLCEPRTLLLDSAASEAREREQQVILDLSNAAGDYNNQPVELRLEQLLEGVATPVPYKTVELKLQRPFGSDFDDF
ncbi:BREX-1 system phosphatase PglZ type A [Vulcanococcus limneticus Candia 3F8]|uniref:BREX-1 system phosphatase PglZ type A n=1 Tax=Vulcanococcus limneticus TaxID=2170428 RepID=UPI000B989183|nr:BREX-1 system phosphatase PglZ type A [Vulcanococcus limneticus]MCP9793319.1 BREX-1 system phosphatase PglZ type A [Vulcanococcus limneticus MW73D5]MCP9895328.1 BREX-1 system phosphatase PglZ type A [Vulcanococcus limneticus Candia 3F8]MCP9898726.1 BREX-1 system phosphatase PglZ type A [Vulcanococcus limneticus Candia 3B3]